MSEALYNLHDTITQRILKTYVSLLGHLTCDEAIASLRAQSDLPDISYLYIVNKENQLLGVLPTRRLLSAPPQTLLSDLMHGAVCIPHDATIARACEFFTEHKFLGFPVTDGEKRLVGIVDVTLFTRDVVDVLKRREIDDLFETLGVHISNLASASPLGAFRYRFPWFLATIGSGTLGAIISSFYGATLEKSIIIAFFLTLVLGLAESMSVQAMTVAIQGLYSKPPTWKTFGQSFLRELGSGSLLAFACGLTVFAIIFFWYHALGSAGVIGGSVFVCTTLASLIGVSIPNALHALKLNFRIAAGPLTLALTDMMTLTCYFSIASFYL